MRTIDADGHVIEPADLWERELPASLRARGFRIRWTADLAQEQVHCEDRALLPAGIIATQVHGVTTLIMEAGQVLTAGVPDQLVAGLTPAEVSATVSTRLLFTVGAGGLLSIGLLLLAGLNLFPLRSARPPFALAGYGWTVLGVVGLATGWLLIQLTADIRAFENFL